MNNLFTKKDLTSEQLAMGRGEMNRNQKSKGAAFVLGFFLGNFGGHGFYSGDIGYVLGTLFTLEGCGIWTIIDASLLGNRIDQVNEQIEFNVIEQVKLMTKE